MRSLLACLLLALAACATSAPEPSSSPREPATGDPNLVALARAPDATITLSNCGEVRVQLDAHAVTIASEHVNARIPRLLPTGTLDLDAVDNAMGGCHFGGNAIVAVTGELPYADVIAIMDAMVKRGVREVALDTPDLTAAGLAPQPPLPADLPFPSGTDGVAPAPLLTIRAAGIELSGAVVTPEPLASRPVLDDAAARIIYDALLSYHRTSPDAPGVLIVQADASTPSTVIFRAAAVAKAAGFSILFAVKKS